MGGQDLELTGRGPTSPVVATRREDLWVGRRQRQIRVFVLSLASIDHAVAVISATPVCIVTLPVMVVLRVPPRRGTIRVDYRVRLSLLLLTTVVASRLTYLMYQQLRHLTPEVLIARLILVLLLAVMMFQTVSPLVMLLTRN